MSKLYNLARMTTATTGTGTITLGSAVSGFLSFAGAGVQDGEIVSYGIRDGANSEVGTGTYTASGTTLSRTVKKSTNSNNAISLSGNAEVFITALAENIKLAQMVITLDSETHQTATVIPSDNTIPQNTEGAEAFTVSITPTSADSDLYIDVSILIGTNAAGNAVVALFRDSGANALAAEVHYHSAANTLSVHRIQWKVAAGSTATTTFKVRFGATVASSYTVTVNGIYDNSRIFGGVAASSIRVMEYCP